jgi:hypothetical protein
MPLPQSSQSMAAAAGGASGAAVVLVTWGLGLAHVTVPAEVAAAMMVLATPVLHWAAVRLGMQTAGPPTTPLPSQQ